jgi:hypothetical protein
LSVAIRATLPADVLGAVATVVVAGGCAVGLYLLLARLFDVRELMALIAVMASRIRRRAAPH